MIFYFSYLAFFNRDFFLKKTYFYMYLIFENIIFIHMYVCVCVCILISR